MRRSICYCQPNHAFAGEVNTWEFVYTPSVNLPKGTRLKFDLMSKGRDIDWEIPTTNSKKTNNIIFAKMANGKVLPAKEIEVPDSFTPEYEFILPSVIEAGKSISIIVGSPKTTDAHKNGTKAQVYAQRRRQFFLYVDTTGKGHYSEPEVFSMDIRGAQLQGIRVLTPSFVSRNKRFDVVVRFEDEFGNLTNNAPDETLIELSHEHLRENLTWKLFVPETGFITLPNLYFNEPGIYTIRLKNTHTNEIFQSCPIRCFAENNRHLYWGTLHGESEKIDSTENIESCLRHFRDENALNFFGCSPFENVEETSNDIWKLITQNMTEFDESDRFTTFLGFQFQGVPKKEGNRQIVYLKDQKQILRKKDPKYSTLSKIYKSFSPKEIISIPTFTMGKGYEYNFDDFDPDYERVVEIYNSWGSSECLKKEGNLIPIQCSGKKGVQESAEGSIQKALSRNFRFGFVAGGLDDRGIYADFYDGDQVQFSPGLTAIIANEHTKSSMAEALYNRSCYATTGQRIILGIYLAGLPMGSETSTGLKHGLKINRHISGYVAGTTKIKSIEIVRNGKVIKTFEPNGYALDFTFDDMVPIEKIVIDAKDKKPPFIYYYIRVVQEDGHMAWSSPIWVDYIANATPTRKALPVKPIKGTKKIEAVIDMSKEDEEEEDYDDEDDFE